eukprot:gene3136-3413_t
MLSDPCNEGQEQNEQPQTAYSGLDEDEPAETEEEPPEGLDGQAEPQQQQQNSPTAETAELGPMKPKKAPKCQTMQMCNSLCLPGSGMLRHQELALLIKAA